MKSESCVKNFNEPEETVPGLYRLRLPQPKYGSVYVHLAMGGQGPLTLFDAGLPHQMTQDALEGQLRALGIGISDLEQIVYTHSHIDHMGGGYIISGKANDVRHLAFQGCVGLCEDFPEYNRRVSSWKTLLSHLNYVPALRDQVTKFLPMDEQTRVKVFAGEMEPGSAEVDYQTFAPGGAPIRFARGLREGDIVEAGPYRWNVLETPGHNPHHLVFVEQRGTASITGDLILDHGTPIMRSMGDDVSMYLKSLAGLARQDLGWVLPSHGRTFSDGNIALQRVKEEREALLDWVWNALGSKPQRLVDLSLSALQQGVAGKKANPMLLIGVLESALSLWCERGVAAFDERSGIFCITFQEPSSRQRRKGTAA